MTVFHSPSPLLFAHRGGLAHFRENTVEAFEHALGKGIGGLETDAFVTSDGIVVLDHDGVLRKWWYFGGTSFAKVLRTALPPHIPTLDDLYKLAGLGIDVSIDVKGDDTAEPLIEVVRSYGPTATRHLWLAHKGYTDSNWQEVAKWRDLDPNVHLIDSTAPNRFDRPPLDYAKRAFDAGIEVLNMRAKDWTPELADIAREAGLKPFAFGVKRTADAYKMVSLGMQGLFADDVNVLLAVKALESPEIAGGPEHQEGSANQ